MAMDPSLGGVEEIMSEKGADRLIIIPNPVISGEPVKIQLSGEVAYNVYSINGKMVQQGISNEIATNGLSSGIYIVAVKVENAIKTAKLVIK